MTIRKQLLATAAAAALVGAMTSGAMAFDSVDWNWTADVNIDVNLALGGVGEEGDPLELDGLVKLEKVQVHVGDLTATANGTDVNNETPVANVTIENIATAVANNQNIETDTPLALHDLQIAYGALNPVPLNDGPNWIGFWQGVAGLADVFDGEDNAFDGINSHSLLFAVTMLMAGNNFIEPAAISASADLEAATGLNTSNAATAVTNNASWTVNPAGEAGGDSILVGDLIQLGFANVTADATIDGISVLGSGGSVSNKATAVGNNLNVSVNVPSPGG